VKFEVTILGSGSAAPTLGRNPSGHLVNIRERFILVDCGEGTQVQLRRYKIKFQRINHIMISHLHGDHFFGLVGLLSTFHLLGREMALNIYAPKALQDIIELQLKVSATRLRYPLNFIYLESKSSELIFEDNLIEVRTIPLDHRVYCNGFLIREKVGQRRINKELLAKYKIPLAIIPQLKDGKDWEKESGEVLKNEVLTLNPHRARAYAYCSDTRYNESILDHINDVDLLYCETTFLKAHLDRAKATFHCTAEQAATLAKKANVGRLLTGHYSGRYSNIADFEAEAKTVFDNVVLGSEGVKVEIKL